jgi:DNA invertase Pin-like site-specific DNA recombinase
MLVGYARDSGGGQSLELQLRALNDAGCAKMFSQQKNGTPAGARNALESALDFVRGGDTLVVTRLEHLAPSSSDIHGIIARLTGSGVNFRCLQQSRLDSDDGQGSLSSPFLALLLPSLQRRFGTSASAIR